MGCTSSHFTFPESELYPPLSPRPSSVARSLEARARSNQKRQAFRDTLDREWDRSEEPGESDEENEDFQQRRNRTDERINYVNEVYVYKSKVEDVCKGPGGPAEGGFISEDSREKQ